MSIEQSDYSNQPSLVQRTLRDVAHSQGVRGGDLAEAIGLPRTVDKGRTLWELGIDDATAKRALAQLQQKESVNVQQVEKTTSLRADVTMSIRELAHANDINGMVLTHALALPLSVDKDTPVEKLGVETAQLRDVILHLTSESASGFSFLKYWLWPPLLFIVLWWLNRGGRYKNGKILPASKRYSKAFNLTVLAVVVILFGFILGKSPNPMEGIVKVFKAFVGIYPDFNTKLLFLGYFSVLAIIGNKLICGWGCPFGALQELFYELPLLKNLPKIKIPFPLSQALRNIIFLFFLLVLFGLAGWKEGMVIYHYVNPFNLFSFEFGLWIVNISIAMFLILSLVVYRPFCQLICPFGWYSWVIEKVSLFGVRIDRDRCSQCGVCSKACPTEAALGRAEGRSLPPDCFSCARCLSVCPTDAIDYGCRLSKR